MRDIFILRTLLSFAIIFTLNLSSEEQSDADSFFGREAPVYPAPDHLIGWIDSRQIFTLNGEWLSLIHIPSPRDATLSRMPSSA